VIPAFWILLCIGGELFRVGGIFFDIAKVLLRASRANAGFGIANVTVVYLGALDDPGTVSTLHIYHSIMLIRYFSRIQRF
jgi:hypothetical protein